MNKCPRGPLWRRHTLGSVGKKVQRDKESRKETQSLPPGSAIEQVSLSETQLLLLGNQPDYLPSCLPTRDLHPKNVGSGLRTLKNPQSGPRIWNDRPQPKGARVGDCRLQGHGLCSPQLRSMTSEKRCSHFNPLMLQEGNRF